MTITMNGKTYIQREAVVLPYSTVKELKSFIPELLTQEATAESMINLLSKAYSQCETLIKANFAPEIRLSDLDIMEAVEAMQGIFEDIKRVFMEEVPSYYIIREYDENFDEVVGMHTTERVRVKMKVIESAIDIMSMVSTMTDKDDPRPVAEKVTNLLEEIDDTIISSFDTLDSIRLDYTNALDLVQVLKGYALYAMRLFGKLGKNAESLKAEKTQSK